MTNEGNGAKKASVQRPSKEYSERLCQAVVLRRDRADIGRQRGISEL